MDIAVLNAFLLQKFDEIIEIVSAMDDDSANRAPEVPGANTPYQILTHCLGMMNEWVFKVNLAHDIVRDRDAEFEAGGEVAELIARARVFRSELVIALQQIKDNDSAAPVWLRAGEPPYWAHSHGGVLLHVCEELCQHLGHLEITRDVNAASSM